MLKVKIFIVLMAFKNLLAPSSKEKEATGFYMAKKGYKISKTGNLPDTVRESSGLELANEVNTFWTHGDGACPGRLYQVDEKGNVLSTIDFSLPNKDWEDIARDDNGNSYIGDFGNNLNKRKDLVVYKVNPEGQYIGAIEFSYPDQKAFPPTNKEMNFDCEAIFSFRDSLYIFSKNRGEKSVVMYSLPTKPGKYTAIVSDRFYLNSMITAADISPDKKTVALMAYGKIYFFCVEEQEGRLKLKADFSRKANKGLTEALVFINNTDLLISNEQGKLFMVEKRK